MRQYICLILFFISCSCILKAQPLTLTFSITPTTCRIPADGAVTVNISGGAAPYSIEFDHSGPVIANGASHTFTGLSNGKYQVHVTDDNGHKTDVTDIDVGITPNPYITDTDQSKLAHCDDVLSGTITVVAKPEEGGSNEFKYMLDESGDWKDSGVFGGLTEDLYTVTVIDGNACISTKEIFVRKSRQPVVTATGSNIQCFSKDNQTGSIEGTITVNAVAENDLDGTPGSIRYYQLFTDEGNPLGEKQSNGSFARLTAGDYTVRVTDIYGCENEASAEVRGPESQIKISRHHIVPPVGNSKGSITVTAAGGWEDYTIVCNKIVASVYQLIKEFTNAAAGNYTLDNLDAGTYQFTISDKEGCSCTSALVIDLDQSTGEMELDASGFSVYPNPSGDGRFVLEWNNMEDRQVTLEVYSMSGQLIYKTGAQTGVPAVLDLSSRNQGAYLLYVPEMNIRQKLVVQ